MNEDYKKKSKLYRKKMTEVNRLFELTYEDKIEICKKYEDYGIEGETDVWDALNKEYEYKYGIYDLERLSGNQDDTDTAEVRRKRYSIFNFQDDEELDEKALLWKETFHNPQEYLDAFREFIELNFVVDVISGEHSLKDSILYILEKEGFNKMDDDVKFVSVYAELNRALRIARRKI